MKETIAEMLKVEARAREILAAAEEQAGEIVRKARMEAAAIQEQARRNAQARAEEMIRQGVEQARKRRSEMLALIDADNERLRPVAEDKADAARKTILAALTD